MKPHSTMIVLLYYLRLNNGISTPYPNSSLDNLSEDISDVKGKRCLIYEFENLEKHHKENLFVSALP